MVNVAVDWFVGDRSVDCIEWPYAVSDNGYGNVWFEGRNWGPHCLVLALLSGPAPKGTETLHACDNRRCFNPAHLRYGTHRQNQRDMVDRGRHGGGIEAAIAVAAARRRERTHCPHGHELTEDNVYLVGPNKTARMCKTCNRERSLARWRANR